MVSLIVCDFFLVILSAKDTSRTPQQLQKHLFRNMYPPFVFHTLFAFALLYKQFFLTTKVAAGEMRSHIFSHRGNGFARHNFTIDRALNRDRSEERRVGKEC